MKRSYAGRLAIVLGASLVMVGVGGASAFAADGDDFGTGDVEVSVKIEPVTTPGSLSMSISGTSAVLTEDGSDASVRQFVGALPTVTVTDTRTADQIPGNVGWAVMGSASDFVGDAGQEAIPASSLGWLPVLVAGDEEGLVSEGIPVDPAADGGEGLIDRELLVSTFSSGDVANAGPYSANAQLVLKTPTTVSPGSYHSTITLSLFE